MLERAFYFDATLEDGSVLRVMRPRQSIDLIALDDGTLPQADTEAVLEKCYAYYHELGVSDVVRVAGESLRISGIGSVTDYDMPSVRMSDFSSDSETFGLVFVTDDCYQRILSTLGSAARESCVYSYKLAEGSSDADLRRLLVDDLDLLPRLRTFVPADNNNRMGSGRDDNSVYAFAGMVTGIGLMVLISVVFFIRIQFSLDKQGPSIGALLSMGVKRRDIYPMFLLPFALAALAGGLIGFALSCAIPLALLVEGEGFYSSPEVPTITHPLIFMFSVLVPPLVCTLINFLLMRRKMEQPAASLLTSSRASAGGTGGIVLAMVVGSLLAVSVFMMGRGVGLYSVTVAQRLPVEIKYGYAYELAEEKADVPPGAQGAFTHTFAAESHGYVRDVPFIGIAPGNTYFDAPVEGLDGSVVISSAVASRFGLQAGDELSVFDPLTGKAHAFDIAGVTDYNAQLAVFMDVRDLRSHLGLDGVAFNTVYSDAPLAFSGEQLLGTTTKEGLISPVEKLEAEVELSRNVLLALAILFYGVMVAYLIQFAVARRQRDIACLSALGYKCGELTWMVTGKLAALACASAAVSLYVGYRISMLLMPVLVASTPIGLLIDYSLPEYLLHLTGAAAIILVSVLLGSIRVARTDNLYYLRNRE
jgi:ABC-type lipoprotein release transport system permease subunit